MTPQPHQPPNHRRKTNHLHAKRLKHWLRSLTSFFLLACLAWSSTIAIRLYASSQQPVSAILVLGGSIQREMYTATTLATTFPQVPILVSQGSAAPCIRIIFERSAVDLARVWLEECARSTFGNFYYSLPTLQHWHVRKIKLVSSGTHVPRAFLMARIIFGSHGIWVESSPAPETGRPGNTESRSKTLLEIGRSIGWAIGSQFYQPHCQNTTQLSQVNLAQWRQTGFKCERQGNIR
jgi:uncharacterized SAM-binding protein YcdF (DUF218 family)